MFFKHLLAILFWATVLGLATSAQAQTRKAEKDFTRAQELLRERNVTDAIPFLESALKESPDYMFPKIALVDAYAFKKRYIEAEKLIREVIQQKSDASWPEELKLAQLLFIQRKYAEAQPIYEKVRTYRDLSFMADYESKLGLASAIFAQKAIANPYDVKAIPFPATVNSGRPEYMPSLPADERYITFTRIDTQPAGGENLYVAMRNANGWDKATLLPAPPNSAVNEGAHVISADGQTIIFTGCDRRDSYGRCDLYITRRRGNGWSEPVNMGEPINTPGWESQPTLSASGRTLIFASARKGSLGSTDLWESTLLASGQWSEPRNLTELNTRGEENTPFLHPDGQTIYFSSGGLPGFGERDLYMSRMQPNGKWSEPMNLGSPINDETDQTSLFVNANGTTAYYASAAGRSSLDLFYFELPEALKPKPVSYMRGHVYDALTRQPLQASLVMSSMESGQLEYQGESNSDGQFSIPLPAATRHIIDWQAKGYLLYSEGITGTNGLKPVERDFYLTPIRAGAAINLKNLLFPTNSYALSKESQQEIMQLVEFMVANPKITVEMRGHTDNEGTPEANDALSRNRANAVRDALLKAGIAEKRVRARGFGQRDPIAPNTTDDGRQQNRRTEMIVLSTDGEIPKAITATTRVVSRAGWSRAGELYLNQRLYKGNGDDKAYFGTVLAFRKKAGEKAVNVLLRQADGEFVLMPETAILAEAQLFSMTDDKALIDKLRTVETVSSAGE